MPSFADRQQSRSEELHEAPQTGPWGGIQSELPLSLIERYGVADAQNITFQRGVARARFGLTTVGAFPVTNEIPNDFADFYDIFGNHRYVVFTPTRVLVRTGVWTPAVGPPLGGGVGPVAWSVLNQRLCFSQAQGASTFPVMLLSFVAGLPVYTLSSASAPSALALAEIGLHLVAANTFDGVNQFPQRYQWSGVGDPTDWTSFSSGTNDELVNLGPVLGLKKLGQYGFGFHLGGIMQVIPTGVGTSPFAFIPIVNSMNGITESRTLATINFKGVDCAVYVGSSNILLFNQTSVEPIGDAPVDGNKRVGARKRIMADIINNGGGNPYLGFRSVHGLITEVVNGDPHLVYRIFLPIKQGAWVYNFDEGNWSYEDYTPIEPRSAGKFLGPLTTSPNGDIIGIGSAAGGVKAIDGTVYSENPISLTSGKLIFDDRRHGHNAKKMRVVVQDIGVCNYILTLTNEMGQVSTVPFTAGNAVPTGDDLSIILPVSVPGLRLQWKLSAIGGQPFSVVEIAPIFDEGGEQRGGAAQ